MRDWLVHLRRNEYAGLQTQIREALVAAILDGQLARDEPIPSTRKMAKSLGVSRNTVALAFDALIGDGLVAGRVGDGTYVLSHTHWSTEPVWRRARRWIRDPDGLLLWITT